MLKGVYCIDCEFKLSQLLQDVSWGNIYKYKVIIVQQSCDNCMMFLEKSLKYILVYLKLSHFDRIPGFGLNRENLRREKLALNF